MAELVRSPEPTDIMPDVTSEMPRSRVSPGAIENSYSELARGEGKLGEGLMDLATPMAESQAASDLQNQKVTLGPDGKIQVLNPARSVIFGRAGEKYGDLVAQGTAAQAMNLVDQQLTKIHYDNLGNPAAQLTAQTAFINGLKGATGNPVADQAIVSRAAEHGTAHYDSNLDYATKLNIRKQYEDDASIVSDREEKLYDLAQNGIGPGNRAFDEAMTERNAARGRLQASPVGKVSPEILKHKDDQFKLGLNAEAIIGGFKTTIQEHGGIPAATQLMDRIKSDATMDPDVKKRILQQGEAIIQSERGQWESNVKQSRSQAEDFVTAIGKRDARVTPNSPAILQFYHTALTLGDTDSIKAIDSAWSHAYHTKAGEGLPDDVRRQIYDLPGPNGEPPPSAVGGAASAGPKGAAAGVVPAGKEVTTSPLPPPSFTPGKLPTEAQPAGQYQETINAAAAKRGLDSVLFTRQLYAENGFRPTGTSPAGAQGIAQFMPQTAAQYGVNVNDPNSSIEGAAHYMADLKNRYNGNAGLAVAAYNWGERNVDHWLQVGNRAVPAETRNYVKTITGHSIEEWRADPNLPMPKDFGSMLAGKLPAGPGANFPYSAAEVHSNPYLMSAWIRDIATQDTGMKISDLKTMVSGFENMAKYADSLPTGQVAAIRQFFNSDPTNIEAQKLWGTTQGLMTSMASGGGNGPSLADQHAAIDKMAHDNPDIYHGWVAEGFQKGETARAEQKRDAPYDFAATRNIAPGFPVAPKFDLAHPEQTGAILAARAEMGRGIGGALKEAPPPLVVKSDGHALSAVISSAGGASALMSIAQTLKPDDLRQFGHEEEAKTALIGAWHSGDPAKMAASYAVLKNMKDNDETDFHAHYEAITAEMNKWRSGMNNADPVALKKYVESMYLGGQTEAADKAAREAAHKAIVDSGFGPSQISAGLFTMKGPAGGGGTSFWQSMMPFAWVGTMGRDNGPPVPAGVDDPANRMMYQDFLNAAEDQALKGNTDWDSMRRGALETVATKYGPSRVGGRVMAYPPEAFVRNADGSQIKDMGFFDRQLDDDVKAHLGLPQELTRGEAMAGRYFPNGMTARDNENVATYYGERVIVGDDRTHAEYASGRTPSYQVYLHGAGGWAPMMDKRGVPQRFQPNIEKR